MLLTNNTWCRVWKEPPRDNNSQGFWGFWVFEFLGFFLTLPFLFHWGFLPSSVAATIGVTRGKAWAQLCPPEEQWADNRLAARAQWPAVCIFQPGCWLCAWLFLPPLFPISTAFVLVYRRGCCHISSLLRGCFLICVCICAMARHAVQSYFLTFKVALVSKLSQVWCAPGLYFCSWLSTAALYSF